MAEDFVRIEGSAETVARLFAVQKNIGTKFMRRAIVAAMRPMLRQLEANTPTGTGVMKAAAGDRARVYGTGLAFGVVGYSPIKGSGLHPHFIEHGTGGRTPKSAPFLTSKGTRPGTWTGRWPFYAKSVGPTPAQHPMQRAYAATAAECTALLTSELAKALDKAIAAEGSKAA